MSPQSEIPQPGRSKGRLQETTLTPPSGLTGGPDAAEAAQRPPPQPPHDCRRSRQRLMRCVKVFDSTILQYDGQPNDAFDASGLELRNYGGVSPGKKDEKWYASSLIYPFRCCDSVTSFCRAISQSRREFGILTVGRRSWEEGVDAADSQSRCSIGIFHLSHQNIPSVTSEYSISICHIGFSSIQPLSAHLWQSNRPQGDVDRVASTSKYLRGTATRISSFAVTGKG